MACIHMPELQTCCVHSAAAFVDMAQGLPVSTCSDCIPYERILFDRILRECIQCECMLLNACHVNAHYVIAFCVSI